MVSQKYNPKKSTDLLVTGPGGLLKPDLEEAAKEIVATLDLSIGGSA